MLPREPKDALSAEIYGLPTSKEFTQAAKLAFVVDVLPRDIWKQERYICHHLINSAACKGNPCSITRHELKLFGRGVFESETAHNSIPAMNICPWMCTVVAFFLSFKRTRELRQVLCLEVEKHLDISHGPCKPCSYPFLHFDLLGHET